MLTISEEYTDEPNYSLGRSAMSKRQIEETEDAGGFKKVVVSGEIDNLKEYDMKSVKKAVTKYQSLIKSGESIAVFAMDGATLPISSAYAKITSMKVSGDKVLAQMTLLDTKNGNMANTMLKGIGPERLTLKADGVHVDDKLDVLLNVKLGTV